jgi:predicted kinase
MMRAGLNDPKNPVVVVGLSAENILRLKNDMPIRADLRTFGVDMHGTLIICYGETELELKRLLQSNGLIGQATKGETDARLVEDDAIRDRHAGDKILICTVGLPRSGKSTWAKSQAYPIVNPDAIRLAIHGQRFIAEAEPFVWATAKAMVRALFLAGHNRVILDATNTTRKRRDEWRSDGWATFFKQMDATKKDCYARAHEAGDAEIVFVITRMAEQFEPLADDEEVWP